MSLIPAFEIGVWNAWILMFYRFVLLMMFVFGGSPSPAYRASLKKAIAGVPYDKREKIRGLEISITTTAKTDEEGRHLLELLGMPFAKDGME